MGFVSFKLDLGLFDEPRDSNGRRLAPNDNRIIVQIVIVWISMILTILNICVNSCLIHGANNAKLKLLLPWLILVGINICLSIINVPWLLVSLQFYSAVINFVYIVICGYLFIVVLSFKKELENGDKPAEEVMAMKA